jgi:hypothetical protein
MVPLEVPGAQMVLLEVPRRRQVAKWTCQRGNGLQMDFMEITLILNKTLAYFSHWIPNRLHSLTVSQQQMYLHVPLTLYLIKKNKIK